MKVINLIKNLNKIIVISFIGMLIISGFIIFVPNNMSAEITTHNNYTFESGNDGYEVVGGGSAWVRTPFAHSGNYGMKLGSGSSTTGNIKNTGITLPSGGCNITLWFFANNTVANDDSALIYLSEDTLSTPCLGIYLHGTTFYYAYASADYRTTSISYSLNVWNCLNITLYDNYDKFKIQLNSNSWSNEFDSSLDNSAPDCIYHVAAANVLYHIDDITVCTGFDENELIPLGNSYSSYPTLVAFKDIPYWYDATIIGSNVTYSINTNATFLSVNSTNGNITGTPNNEGYYYVNITATNLTESISQNYTLSVQSTSNVSLMQHTSLNSQFRGYGMCIVKNDTIYCVWQGEDLNPMIRTFNTTSCLWSPSYLIGDNPLANDGHGAPYIYVDYSGYIHCVFGSHISEQKYAKSKNPYDISSWNEMTSPILASATYATIMGYYDNETSSETLYIFARIGDAIKKHIYIKSTDGGETWSSQIDFIISTGWPYVSYGTPVRLSSWNNSVWAFAITVYQLPYPTGHNEDLFMFIFNPDDEKCYSVDGQNDYGISVDIENELFGNSGCIMDTDYEQYFDMQDVRVSVFNKTPYIGFTIGNSTENGGVIGNYKYGVAWFTDVWNIITWNGTILRNDMVSIVNANPLTDEFTAFASYHNNADNLYTDNGIAKFYYNGNIVERVGNVITYEQQTQLEDTLTPHWYMSLQVYGGNHVCMFLGQNQTYLFDSEQMMFVINGTKINNLDVGWYDDNPPIIPEPEPFNPYKTGKMMMAIALLIPFIGFIVWALGKKD